MAGRKELPRNKVKIIKKVKERGSKRVKILREKEIRKLGSDEVRK
jgi:hypothetical protein